MLGRIHGPSHGPAPAVVVPARVPWGRAPRCSPSTAASRPGARRVAAPRALTRFTRMEARPRTPARRMAASGARRDARARSVEPADPHHVTRRHGPMPRAGDALHVVRHGHPRFGLLLVS